MILAKRSLLYLARRKLQTVAYDIFGPVTMEKVYFRIINKRNLNLKNPIYFKDKMVWYKLNYCPQNPLIIQCSDKYLVHKYLKHKGLIRYCVPLLGVWDNANDIDFDALPERFAIKCNHGCAYNIICTNKKNFDKAQAVRLLNAWLREDFGKFNCEPHYDKIPKKIICEQFVESLANRLPTDYKFHCFHGKPTILEVCRGRTSGGANYAFYNVDGTPSNIGITTADSVLNISAEIIYEMNKIAEQIAIDFPYVRVDLYLDQEQIMIGELTFSSGAGHMTSITEAGDFMLGKAWNVPVGVKHEDG